MKLKYSVITSMVLILLITIALPSADAALTLDTSCNITTSIYTELLHNGSAITYNNTFTCPNGCANNGLECDSPAQAESFFAFAIVFSFAAFTFAYLALKIDEEYKPLQFMFLAFSVLYIAFVTYIISGFSTLTLNNLNTIMVQSYIIGVMTVLGVVFYFMYLLIIKLFDLFKIKKKSGRPWKW